MRRATGQRRSARIVAVAVVVSTAFGGLAVAAQQATSLTVAAPLNSGATALAPAERLSMGTTPDNPDNPANPPTTDPPTTNPPTDPPVDPPANPGDQPPAVDPPTTGGSTVDAFVRGVIAEPDGHSHNDDAAKANEHMALLRLVTRSNSSHVAVADGPWTSASTWYRGAVPTASARVLIPRDIDVAYNASSNTSLFTVRVDGSLSFSTDRSTRMVVDTLVVAPSGRLEIGTEQRPVGANIDAEILIAANGNIDTTWDPTLVSRGVISHGAVEIHGAVNESFVKVALTPLAGHTDLVLQSAPAGWQVGDRIVLTGTKQLGWFWDNTLRAGIYHDSQDEERTITSISGATITLDAPLQFDHRTPRADLAAYVANTSRSITVRSVGGESLPVHQRGHAMFMHSDDVDVRYAAFDDLGRTDKSQPAADLSFFDSITATTNVKGRYSVHFHKTGTERQEDPAIVIGNSVSRSPGWGFAHHSSHANFTDNVAFDVFGAAFAAEDGDETGIWLRNIAIKSEGIGWGDWTVKEGADVARHDNGRTGDGFFFAGRLVEAAENVAANTTNGYVWFHRGRRTNPATENLQHPEVAYGRPDLLVNRPAIEGFRDNESFANHTGVMVIKSNPAQRHDVRTVFDGFLGWETVEGVNLSYTAHYTLLDFDLVGLAELEPFQNRRAAFHGGTNASDLVLNGVRMERFATGLDFALNQVVFDSDGRRGHVVIDPEYIDVDTHFVEAVPGSVRIMSSAELIDRPVSFDLATSVDTTLSLGERLFLDGDKHDSIGTTPRQIETDRHEVEGWQQISYLLASQGYWRRPDGSKVILLHDIVSDRATGDVEKIIHLFELDETDERLANDWWFGQIGAAVDNGEIDLGGPAPTAMPDALSAPSFTDVVLDVVGNDSDPDGGSLSLSGTTDPTHGDVHVRSDGTLLYRSDFGFTGIDSFDYWIIDEEGNLARTTVAVNVTAVATARLAGFAATSTSASLAASDTFICTL